MSAVPAWRAGRRAYAGRSFTLRPLLVVFQEEAVVKPCFGVLPGLYRVVEPGVDAQVVPFPFEADGGAPPLLPGVPLHAGHAAGIVFADRLGAEHLHAGPVDISKAGPANGGRGLSEKVLDRKSVV